jgi:hypothetical protein
MRPGPAYGHCNSRLYPPSQQHDGRVLACSPCYRERWFGSRDGTPWYERCESSCRPRADLWGVVTP